MDKETRIWESIVAALVIGLSLLAWVVSAGFPKGDNALVGPALFPRILGVILTISSLVLLLNSWRAPVTTPVTTSSKSDFSATTSSGFGWIKLLRALALLFAVALTPLCLAQFGLLATAVILTVGVCFLLGSKWHEALIAGGVMLVFVYLVFVLLLKVQA